MNTDFLPTDLARSLVDMWMRDLRQLDAGIEILCKHNLFGPAGDLRLAKKRPQSNIALLTEPWFEVQS